MTKLKNSIIGALALSAFALNAAHAQTTRAAVKAEAAANVASQPLGERSTPNQDKGARPPMMSSNSRAAVRADAVASGSLSQGERSIPSQGGKPAPQPRSTESREAVKAGAVAAERDGGLSRGKGVEDKKIEKATSPKP